MCHSIFCCCNNNQGEILNNNPATMRTIVQKIRTVLFKFNQSYQLIATGGLLAITFSTLMEATLEYKTPGLMFIALTYAAGLLSLAITILEKTYLNDIAASNDEVIAPECIV